MSNYSVVKTATDAYIKRNGRKEITGPILNNILNAIIDSLGKYYQFVGVASPATNPGTPDENVAYIAATAGTYPNMGGETLSSGEIAVLLWNGEWEKQTVFVMPSVSEGNVFIATYGVTSFGEMKTAYVAGKVVLVKYYDATFFPTLMDTQANEFFFFAFDEVATYYYFMVSQNDGWGNVSNETFVQWGSVITSWPTNPSNFTLPGSKLVKDSLDAKYEKPSGGIPSTDMDAAVQTSLGNADTAVQPGDLASVATSGDYNDLDNLPTIPSPQVQSDWNEADVDDPSYIKNKPSIPAAQVQSDWNEADNTEPSYIKNKPTIPTVPDISTDIVTDRASDTKTASPKAVFDASAKYGVISQTQTWTQAADGGYDYAMSNLVWGAIPQANIDLYKAAGATFNAVTGYFELNGLTDLSYEEMQAVYDANFSAKMVSMNIANALRIVKPARTVSLSDGVVYFSVSLINGLRVGSGGAGTDDSSIEVVAIGTIGGYPPNASSIQQILYNCPYVKRVGIIQPINFTSTSPSNASLAFNKCFSLEEVMLKGLAVSIDFAYSPRLTAASVAYIINNAATAAITITLHATAYARATADAAVTAALAAKPNVTLASA